MKRLNKTLTQSEVDQFGRASAALLSQSSQNLPANIKNRLHAARLKALSVQKPEKVHAQKAAFAGISANWSTGSSGGLWDNVGWIAPVVVLVFGLIGIAQWQDDSRIHDIAEVDVALLTDDVPPDAYADSGFMAFLKNGPATESEDNTPALEQSK